LLGAVSPVSAMTEAEAAIDTSHRDRDLVSIHHLWCSQVEQRLAGRLEKEHD
jgi:hypothetical protein